MAEEKIRFQIRISPDTDRRIKAAMELADCRSQNEFVEEAVRFYCSYLQSGNNLDYLVPTLSSALTGIVCDMENHLSRLLFKLTVELSMTMHILAAAVNVDENKLPGLRERCIRDIRGTSGSIKFDNAVRYQRGG